MRSGRLVATLRQPLARRDIDEPSHRLRRTVATPLTMRGGYVGELAIGELKCDLVRPLKAEVGFLR